jgi:hypothetical protein
MPITWEKTESAEFPYRTFVDGQMWQIKINDFPEEPLYTLIIQGNEIVEFDDWSSFWKK